MVCTHIHMGFLRPCLCVRAHPARQVECVPYTAPAALSIPDYLLPELPRRSRGDVCAVQPFTVSVLPEVRHSAVAVCMCAGGGKDADLVGGGGGGR